MRYHKFIPAICEDFAEYTVDDWLRHFAHFQRQHPVFDARMPRMHANAEIAATADRAPQFFIMECER